jgi:hypothetical protein
MSIALLFLASVSSVSAQTRSIPTNVQGSVFDPREAKYVAQPTVAELKRDKQGGIWLTLRSETGVYDPLVHMDMKPFVSFRKQDVSQYLALIEKFLAWDTTATQRGDTLTKEIGTVSKPGFGKKYDKLTFLSQSPTEHFLAISFCAIGTCTGSFDLVFSPTEAVELKDMLEALRDGRLEQTDIDSIYK